MVVRQNFFIILISFFVQHPRVEACVWRVTYRLPVIDYNLPFLGELVREKDKFGILLQTCASSHDTKILTNEDQFVKSRSDEHV